MNQSSDTVVEGDYFGTMGIPLLRGRFFSPEESVNGSNPVIISQSFARRYFAGKDPIGLRLKFIAQQQPTSWLTVVGLVGDVKPFNLDDEILPEAYVPFTSEEIPILQRLGGVSACLSVRTRAESGGIAAALQSVVRTLDRQLPVTEVMTMNQVVDQSTAPRRFTLILVISFASAALLLAATGLYGVIANSVTQRTHEVGIRMALGAAGTDIRRMVLGWGLTLTAVGVAVGLAGAWALTRLLSSVLSGLLFGVRPFDPITFAGVTGLLTVVALVACLLPAARASKVDPMSALRCD
ncbi:MAG: FtsX-like permease family protein [Blastocatellia bacterium]